MNIKQFLMAAALISVMSTAAIAEEAAVPAAAAPVAAEKAEKMTPAEREAKSAENFAARKAKIQKRLSDRIAKIQQRQACVNAAADRDALKACFPDRKNKGEGAKEGAVPVQ